MRKPVSVSCVLLCLGLFILPAPSLFAQKLPVRTYYGIYDATRKVPGFPSKSLKGPKTEQWVDARPKKPYNIGVLLPHLKDSYWQTADYGIVTYARKLGLHITLYTAGAYINFGNQRAQLQRLVDVDKVDGIILASVDYMKMDPFIAAVTKAGTPVVALINDVHAPAISAKSMVSFFQMGYEAGEYVVHHSHGRNIKIAFFPGPKKSGWAPESYQGFLAAIFKLRGPHQRITMLRPLYGDTRPDVQKMRLDLLNKKENHDVDYIVGNAVAAVAAVGYLRDHRAIQPHAKIVATYLTSTVYEQIRKGFILAAPSDQTIMQCKIALDMVVRILNGEKAGKDLPFRASPLIPLISAENIDRYPYDKLFGGKDFRPVVEQFQR
ncbi:MAG: TMAO reductase system periplasmic protein TorT [Syntrophobacteraceae bacterium]